MVPFLQEPVEEEPLVSRGIKRYFAELWEFLRSPKAFVIRVQPQFAASLARPVTYVIGAVAAILAIGQVNLNLYDERITRVIVLPDIVMSQIGALVSICLLGFTICVVVKLQRARLTVREALGLTLYGIAFAIPIQTVIFISTTRVCSALAGEPIIFIPPERIIELGAPDGSWAAGLGMAVLFIVQVGWNLYMTWLLWAMTEALTKLGGLRTGVTVGVSIVAVFSISGILNSMVGAIAPIIEPVLKHFVGG